MKKKLWRVDLPAWPAPVPTRRSCESASMMGLSFEDDPVAGRRNLVVELTLSPGSVTLLTGPSGGGKSSLLSATAHALRAGGWIVMDQARVRLANKPAVDLVATDAASAMRRLAGVGLAEARCFLRRPAELSDGQRQRLGLAVTLDRAMRQAHQRRRNVMVVADEFAAALDRATARSVARLLSRSIHAGVGVSAIVATSHSDLEMDLAPDEIVRVALDGGVVVERPPAGVSPADDERFEIVKGSKRDYDRLAWLHYRAGAPVAVVQTLAAREVETGRIAGALVVSMPTLNGAWRDLAWPGRYRSGDKRADTRRLNDEVRRIARVVVDPRHRGLGLASSLVRAYLDEPLTICTEAVAAMGRWSRFFQAGGMTRYTLARRPPDARLLDALDHAGVESFRLATPTQAWRRAVDGAGEAFITRELRRWGRARARARTPQRNDVQALWRCACRRVAVTMNAYAHSAIAGANNVQTNINAEIQRDSDRRSGTRQ